MYSATVIGPVDDGGYYLLGLRRLPLGLLSGLPWSTHLTRQATCERLTQRGLKLGSLDACFDVDELPDARRLQRLLAADPAVAPVTAALLHRLDLGS